MPARRILVLSTVLLSSMTSFGASSDTDPFEARVAQRPFNPQEPQTLLEIFGFIERIFEVSFSVEALPEGCVGTAPSEPRRFPPFAIARGETFGEVIRRFVALSQYRYKVEEIRGVPILRRNDEVVGEPDLLDTVVSLNVKGVTMWEALCVLAREINGKNLAEEERGKALIDLFGPNSMPPEPPDPIFLEKPIVTLDLAGVTAREALCAILESGKSTFDYSYSCREAHDYIYIDRAIIGKARNRRRTLPTKEELESMKCWDDVNISKLQLPPGPGAANVFVPPPPIPSVETPAPPAKPADKGSIQDHMIDGTPAPAGGNWKPVVASGCTVVIAAVCVIGVRRRFLRKR